MKKIILIVIINFIVTKSKSMVIDSVAIKSKKIWNFGRMNICKRDNQIYLIRLEIENKSNKEKLLLTNYKNSDEMCEIDECYIGDGIQPIRPYRLLLQPKSKNIIYKIVGKTYGKNKLDIDRLKYVFVCISWNDDISNKYDYLIYSDIIKTTEYKKQKKKSNIEFNNWMKNVKDSYYHNQEDIYKLIILNEMKYKEKIIEFELNLK